MKLNLVKNGKYLLLLSLLLLLIGIVFIGIFGLKFGIDFTGGTVLTYSTTKPITQKQILSGIDQKKYSPIFILHTNTNTYSITTKPTSQTELQALELQLNKNFQVKTYQSVQATGPVIGKELQQNAVKAILIASIAIIFYIAYAFRHVPRPVSSWTFGVTAVLAMVHDVFIVLGAFAILGYFFDARIDSLFVTAVLTVIGFSVHDTIVVFDRIRENLGKSLGSSFEDIVNASLVETLARSINTSLTVIFTLLALFLLGGESIRWFVLTLLIGITSGTYSSIFVTSQLLVLYERFKLKKQI